MYVKGNICRGACVSVSAGNHERAVTDGTKRNESKLPLLLCCTATLTWVTTTY